MATQRLGQKIGRRLHAGVVIELVGDLGSGKTTFTQGLAIGVGFTGEVVSPTFTLSRVYPLSGGRQLHHFDWYRLSGPDVVTTEFMEAAADPTAVVVVEWAGNAKVRLPAQRLRVTLQSAPQDATTRTIQIESLGGAAGDLVAGLARTEGSRE